MKIAVTGGLGFLGDELVKLLLEKKHQVVVLTRKYTSSPKPVEIRTTDYTIEALSDCFKDIEAVVHLASVRGAGGGISDFLINEVLAENIFRAAYQNNINNIVQASTISVYSDCSKIPWNESQVIVPKTFYGISKLACEHIGAIYNRKYGMSIKSLRIAQILGEGERKGFMMNTFIDRAFNKEQLVVNGKSIAKREFVYVKDVANAINCALNNPRISGVFNIGSNEAYTNLEIATIINNIFHNENNLIYNDNSDEGIESSLMTSHYAETVLGYKPNWSLHTALKDIHLLKLNR